MNSNLVAKRSMYRVEVCDTKVEPPRPGWIDLPSAQARQTIMFKQMENCQRLTVPGCYVEAP
jgi:hypothetical protein